MTDFYNPGELLYSEKPFGQVVRYAHRGSYCDYCFKGGPETVYKKSAGALKMCTACRYVYYCSQNCQRSAWRYHKGECCHLKKLPESGKDIIRLIGQIILKLNGKNWDTFHSPVGGLSRSFQDLISHCDVTKDHPELSLHGIHIIYLLKQYLIGVSFPSDDQLLEIIGKVKHNQFPVGNLCEQVGSALYIGASLFNHSCIPNAVRSFEGNVMKIRAIANIPKGDMRNVTISYTSMVDFVDHFRKTRESFYGPCQCVDCCLPYGESVLTKILDRTQAYPVIEGTKNILEQIEAQAICANDLLLQDSELIEDLLKMQENVLGDTNLLRLRLLFFKARKETDQNKKTQDLQKLLESLKLAFGEYSLELVPVYHQLGELCDVHSEAKNHEARISYKKKLQDLLRILYGHCSAFS